MKIIHYSLSLLIIATSFSYAENKENTQEKIETSEQLISYLQHPELSKEQKVAAADRFKETAIRIKNKQNLEQFCDNFMSILLKSRDQFSTLVNAIVGTVSEITSNEQLAERLANDDKLTLEDRTFLNNILITKYKLFFPKKSLDELEALLLK